MKVHTKTFIVLLLMVLTVLAGCNKDENTDAADSDKKAANKPLDVNASYRLVYDAQEADSYEIVTIGADGKAKDMVTTNLNKDEMARPCRTQNKVVFVSDITKNKEVWVSNMEGKQKKNLSLSPQIDVHPMPSPDCTKVVFQSNRNKNMDVYVVGIDGKGLKQLTNRPEADFGPFTFSPDGRFVIYRHAETKPAPHASLMLVDTTTGVSRKLTNMSSDESGAVWAPNGKFIVFAALEKFEWHLYKVFPNGTGLVRIDNPDAANELSPTVSPDSTKVAYIGTNLGQYDVWVSDVDSKKHTQVTDNFNLKDRVNFSPDGKFVAYTERDERVANEIWIADIGGKAHFKVTDNPLDDNNPEWYVVN